MDSEGYIVCDRAFNRVKVKSPQYVAIATLRMWRSLGITVFQVAEGNF